MTNTKELNIAILKSGKTKAAIAENLGISSMGFYKKAKGKTEFKASEIEKMRQILNLSPVETCKIFLNTQ